MEEEPFLLDEDNVKEIAKEYVKRRENLEYLEDVDVPRVKISEKGILHYVVNGKARKRIKNPINMYLYEIEEFAFTLRIYSKDRIYYWPGEWVKRNEGQTLSPNSQSEPSIIPPDGFITLKKNYEIDLKKYKIDLDKL